MRILWIADDDFDQVLLEIGLKSAVAGSMILNQWLLLNPGVWIDLRPSQDPLDHMCIQLRSRHQFLDFLQSTCR